MAQVSDLKELTGTWAANSLDGHKYKAQFSDNIWPKEVNGFEWSVGDAMLEALTGPLKVEKDYFKK